MRTFDANKTPRSPCNGKTHGGLVNNGGLLTNHAFNSGFFFLTNHCTSGWPNPLPQPPNGRGRQPRPQLLAIPLTCVCSLWTRVRRSGDEVAIGEMVWWFGGLGGCFLFAFKKGTPSQSTNQGWLGCWFSMCLCLQAGLHPLTNWENVPCFSSEPPNGYPPTK